MFSFCKNKKNSLCNESESQNRVLKGHGDRILKTNYDGYIGDIENISHLFEEHREEKYGVLSGKILPGEYTINI